MQLTYPILLERTRQGWAAVAPTLPTPTSAQGDTPDQARTALLDAMATILEATDPADLADLVADHDDRGPIAEVRAELVTIDIPAPATPPATPGGT